ncbi:unnamed protein product, partial [Brassica rapa subsp. trilocularis]
KGPQPATPGLLWTRGKEAEPNTRKNLAHLPATCRPPQLRPPILAQPPTLSTVTPFPPELRAYRASAPSDFFDALSSRRRSSVGRTEKASTLPRDKTGDDGSRLASISRVERLQHARRSISTANFQNGRAVTPKPTLL